MEKFLVTGCAGFIGSHLTRRLIGEGVKVVGVDNFSTGRRENIEEIMGEFEFIEGDLCDMDTARKACEGVDYILHQASIPSVPRSVDDPLASMHSSITSTVTLLIAAKDAGVKRLVQAASSSAYGDTETLPKVESMNPKPLSPYAVAKLTQEYYASAFSNCYDIDTVSLRYFNVFGPHQNPKSEYAAVIPKFICLMLEGKEPTIYGDGLQSRDFTYIENVVTGNIMAARCDKKLGGAVINLACGDRITLLDLVEKINQSLGTSIKANHELDRAGDVKHSQAGIEKARELIGFEPVCTLDEGLAKTIEYFKAIKD
ncbi:MAG: SDR family oxidoreductase [Planctomycetes bacterium]|nr:SDR family oxidoreductase [Planctomycetota bacterium]